MSRLRTRVVDAAGGRHAGRGCYGRMLVAFVRRFWPWLVLLLTVIPAVWHVVDFDEDLDVEFPRVIRPTFSPVPPAAYRLAEPGDTLDRIMIYFSAAGLVISASGLVLARGGGLWPAAVALSAGALWYSGTPGPAFDGWYGWGWRSIADPAAPVTVRAGLLAAAIAICGLIGGTIYARRHGLKQLVGVASARGTLRLWLAAAVLALLRQVEIPGVEPVGYWPRWAMIWGMLAMDLALLIEVAPLFKSRSSKRLVLPAVPAAWILLVIAAIDLTWYHRPLARLKVIEPGKIYMSAMPTVRGPRGRAGADSVSNDHQPVSGRDCGRKPAGAGGKEVCARSWDSLRG